MKNKKHLSEENDVIENHIGTAQEIPMHKDAFVLSNEEKIMRIQEYFKNIMETLGLDLTDDSLTDTPKRVAKMFVNELFAGLHPANCPSISNFENKYQYRQMLVEKNVTVYSTCEHHFLPIVGKAHLAYIPNGSVIGLSKINRVVDYYAKRPQVQERLTMQIVKAMQKALGTVDVACVIDAKHLCVNSRGIRDTQSNTVTIELAGAFKKDPATRSEFLQCISMYSQFNP